MNAWAGGPPAASFRAMHLRAVALTATTALLVWGAGPVGATQNLRKAFWGPTEIAGKSQFPVYKQLGVQTLQESLLWSHVAPTRPANPSDPNDPAYHWPADLDTKIGKAAGYGIDVLLMVQTTPSWANGGKDPSWAPTNPDDAAAFFMAAARRYPKVHRWIVWGEPSDIRHWRPTPPPELHKLTTAQQAGARRYARTVDGVYGALKSVSSRNIVIAGNSWTVGTVRPMVWPRYLKLPNGRPPRMDMYGHNPFSARKPDFSKPPLGEGEADFSDLERLGRLVDRTIGQGRKHIPIWISEFTIPTSPRSEFNFYVTRATQASWVTAAFRLARRSRYVAGFGWIFLKDDPPGAAFPRASGGLISSTGQRKPAFSAFSRG